MLFFHISFYVFGPGPRRVVVCVAAYKGLSVLPRVRKQVNRQSSHHETSANDDNQTTTRKVTGIEKIVKLLALKK